MASKIMVSVGLWLFSQVVGASEVTLLGPEQLSAPSHGEVTYDLPALAGPTTGTLILENGDGLDLSPLVCRQKGFSQASCLADNAYRALRRALTRPGNVRVSLNDQTILARPQWQPATGKYTLPLSLKPQNQLKVLVSGVPGSFVRFSVKARVRDNNQPPKPVLSLNTAQGFAPLAVMANALQSSDADGQIQSFHWDFGDGQTASGALVSHIYAFAGSYNLKLTVTDDKGASASISQTVTVIQNSAPRAVLKLASSAQGLAPLMVVFEASESLDPEGQELSYHWDFGDGLELDSGSRATVTHEFQNPGHFTVVLTVKDSLGASSQAQVAVTTTAPELPVEPSSIAPVLADNASPSMLDQVSFLYTGDQALQKNVQPGVMQAERLVVARGRVLDAEGQPLSGVKVRLLHEAEFGETLTRADGRYDFVINGGGNLVLDLSRNGYLRVQRNLSSARLQDYFQVPDLVMTKLDPQVTPVFMGSNQAQIAQGSVQTDADGARTGTILLPANTQAQLVMPDGSLKSVSSLSLRVTEFTVGEKGPQKMPAALPPRSAYTYAAELSADEAIALGATSIQFSKPLAYYVDNFLNMPVGTAVPLGVYNYEAGSWKAENDGLILQILSVEGGLAQVNLGSGQAATASELEAFHFTLEELQTLARLYPVGKTLSRITLNHMTAVDLNHATAAVDVANATPFPNQSIPNCVSETLGKEPGACVIDIAERILEESLPVPGTNFTLTYSSGRVLGRRAESSLLIPLTSPTPSPEIQAIEVEVNVAGQSQVRRFDNITPSMEYRFVWDGRDAYGRVLKGVVSAQVRLRFLVKNQYYYSLFDPNNPQTFDTTIPGVKLQIAPGRGEVYLERVYNRELQSTDLRHAQVAQAVGLWTLDVHHFYEPSQGILYKGNGQTVRAKNLDRVVTTVAGTGVKGFSGDGGPVKLAQINLPNNYLRGPDNHYYFSDSGNHRIRKVDPEGIVTTIAGTGTPGYSGDGGLAINAQINNPRGLAVDRAGNVYFSDSGNHRVRKISASGVITTIAGTGVPGYSGDEGPATEAQLNETRALVLSSDGSMYVSDSGNHLIRRITPDGVIHRFAGTGVAGYSGDGGNALLAQLNFPNFTASTKNGELYIADSGNHVIRKISASGLITTVAGTGTPGFSGDEGPATQAQLNSPGALRYHEEQLFIADNQNDRIRYVDALGVMHTLIGTGSHAYNGERTLPLETNMNFPSALYFLDDESLIYVDRNNHRVRRLGYPVPGNVSNNQILVPDPSGREHYVFDLTGRHLKTLFAETGFVKYQFSYDAQNRLTAIQDGSGNVTQIVRDSAGAVVQIVSPDGVSSQVLSNAQGYLSQFIDPLGNAFQITYTDSGLMTSFAKPKGNTNTYAFDELGYLLSDTGPDGGVRSFSLSSLKSVEHSSPMGRKERISSENHFDLEITSFVSASGLSTTASTRSGSSRISHPDGTQIELVQRKDARLQSWVKFNSLVAESTYDEEEGQFYQSSSQTARSYSSVQGPYSFVRTEKVMFDQDAQKTLTSVFRTSDLSLTQTTGLGRTSVLRMDGQMRPLSSQLAGYLPVQVSYDGRGRINQTSQGSRVTSFGYDGRGFLSEIRDALGRVTLLGRDSRGRLISETRPDGSVLEYGYDANSNLVAIKPPERSAHEFEFSIWDLLAVYRAPGVNGDNGFFSSLFYDKDKLLLSESRADGQNLEFLYDEGGRYIGAQSGAVFESLSYNSKGQPERTTSSDGVWIDYAWIGSQSKARTYRGEVVASLQSSYTTQGRQLASQSVNGSSVNYAFDKDNLLVQVGDLVLSRETSSGLVASTTLSGVSESYERNGYGEISQRIAKYNGSEFYAESYVRDDLGRITSKTERFQGVMARFDYFYDLAGRLIEVKLNGVMKSSYHYDRQGNRLNNSAQYDAQDRLLSFGDYEYTYKKGGELQSKLNTVSHEATTYDYDVFGQLKAVSLPNGRKVEYLTDGERHRVVKKINGQVVKKFVYDEAGRLVAELDANNQLVSRFVYATQAHSPDLMLKSSGAYRLIKDQLGSVRLVVNAQTGGVVQRMVYDEFGVVLADSNPGWQPFGFAGGIYDPYTKLVRFGARDYDPGVGRWLSKDPILFAGGDTNLMSYVANDPVNWVDPSGLARCTYSISTGQLSCSSNDGSQTIGLNAISGGALGGPLPTGSYSIRRAPGQSGGDWFLDPGRFSRGLYRASEWTRRNTGFGFWRGGFNLHLPGRVSEGCISAPTSSNPGDGMSNLNNLLTNEAGSNTLDVIQ